MPRRISPRRKGQTERGTEVEQTTANSQKDSATRGRSRKIGSSDNIPEGECAESDISTTPKARSNYSLKLSESTSFPPSALSSIGSASGRTRSNSPIKRADDLKQLDKPVYWKAMSVGDLTRRISETQDNDVKSLLHRIKRVVVSGREYLPQQLREDLISELGLEEDDTHQFVEHVKFSLEQEAIERKKRNIRRAGGFEKMPKEKWDSVARNTLYLEALDDEMEVLKSIVGETNTFKLIPNPEPEWNQKIHGPMLQLAIRNQHDKVEYKNVTSAKVAIPFVPDTKIPTKLRYATKMIDYVLALRAQDDDFGRRVRNFTATLDPAYFNQSTSDSIRFCPTGVFVETKVNGSAGWSEGKAQLGFWLAAWFKRVSMFPRPSESSNVRIPPMPVILAACDRWELHFAFHGNDEIEICGGLDIGGTGHLDAAYRLLAALRVLVDDWMATGFLQWVKGWL
ncbi:hypothetical protein F5Y13DRAFT_195847 [Hypoxylon sp. FL1857]|nr:hypothetical protein F5Y13DRAFT_195847 [Hypoxylon sp. FL1857]